LKNIVVFASGSGTNFQSLINASLHGEIDASISGLISNKHNIGAIKKAEEHHIPVCILNPSHFADEQKYSTELLQQLVAWKADLIVLAGYLKKIPTSVIQVFPNRILNIHPSLLPKFGGKGFYGLNVHQAVIEAAETESGCSVHIVTPQFDEGPVIAQAKVPVLKDDSPQELAKRILKEEHRLYPKAIQQYLQTL
jgi:formyltetrahydrofolate-dependent phosphoribosylglycinamide formyltransferase